MHQIDIWIKNGTILTMCEKERVIPRGEVLIKGEKILEIREEGEDKGPIKADKEIDATNCLVIPGLVNCHTHLPMTILRGYSDDLPLMEWLFDHIFPAEERYMDSETVYWASLLGCAELIASGITTLSDGYFFADQVADAVNKAGLRAVIGQGVIDFPTPDVKNPDDNLSVAWDVIQKIKGNYKKIIPSIFCHSPITVKEKTLIKSMEICYELGVPLQIHLSETIDEYDKIFREKNMTPTAYLESLNVLGENTVAVHAIHMTSEDIQLIYNTGSKIVHDPESNMKLACGIAKIDEMIKVGIRPGLGTDSVCSNNNMDLFREMDMAAKLQKVRSGDATSLSAKTAAKMATIWGAEVLGMGNLIGSLEPGKEADLIVLDLNSPHLFPLYDPYSLLVYSMKASDVRDVIVGGRALMEDRRFLNLDLSEVYRRIDRICMPIREDLRSNKRAKEVRQ